MTTCKRCEHLWEVAIRLACRSVLQICQQAQTVPLVLVELSAFIANVLKVSHTNVQTVIFIVDHKQGCKGAGHYAN